MILETEIAVVGAGPAGLSAALQASLAGADVIVVDEYIRPGGQYFKQGPSTFEVQDRSLMGRDYQMGIDLMARVEQRKVRLLTDALVWGSFEAGTLEVYRRGECERIKAGRTVIATGAYDRPIAFPGWTLPGVITAGAAQTLMKNQWVLPGSRVLMVGTGPFQLPVAAQLVRAGATVVGVLEASKASSWLKDMPAIWRHLDKVREARAYLTTLLKGRVDMRFGWTILEARGTGRVEQAVIVQVDDEWKPIPGTEETLEVDTICLGFGFIPSLQLPRMLGCKCCWDPEMTAWLSDHDSDQRTSMEEVFVAGETTGIGGHDVALGEGAVAGVRAAADLGHVSAEVETRLVRTREELARQRQFSAFVNRAFAIKPGIYDVIRDDTLLCRCEEVAAGEVAAVAREWNGSLRTIKQMTRAGMGSCQGRMCASLVAQVASRASGKTVEEIGLDTPRTPVKPIPLGALGELTV